MKKKHTVIALIMTLVMACSMTAQAGFTPKYDVDMPTVPDVYVELPDATKDAIDKAVQQQLEKMTLDKPVITNTSYRQTRYASWLYVTWEPIDGATSHKVEVSNQDGTVTTYETQYNWLTLYNVENLDGATVRVKAYGEDGTYSLWSDEVAVSCRGLCM